MLSGHAPSGRAGNLPLSPVILSNTAEIRDHRSPVRVERVLYLGGVASVKRNDFTGRGDLLIALRYDLRLSVVLTMYLSVRLEIVATAANTLSLIAAVPVSTRGCLRRLPAR